MEEQEQEQGRIEERLKTENQFKAGANWFYWIAGLSLVNSAISFSGSGWGFVIGLGVTQFIDALGSLLAEEIGIGGKIVALGFSIATAGVFVLFGFLSRKRYIWAFVVGMVLYSLDGLLFLLVGDMFSFGFHIFALFCIYGGLRAARKLAAVEEVGAFEGEAGGGGPTVDA